ncbi:LAGLIDADG homing endonuclease (mitochondrion) [Rhizoctonia solani AG-1 IB]|jgi:hypothetical protein|uniref:LAGLIDADG homing endonuclease n=1 Tax=Thanatephorus cucumeris (strain AG1-IB / isolate 7/3/14) TaxID=1108050 RepID=M5BJN9_THACB|nr:LAGLIDADG homing endonuclease [Rhizoctonia solani AG-1 IB]
MVLKAIAAFLQSLPKGFRFTLDSLPPVVSSSLNKTTSVSVITINSIDALYDYFMFFLLDMPFQTRKSVDFLYWCLALHFHKFGHFYLPEGRALVNQIAQYTNSGRYSNNSNKVNAPDLSNIINVLRLALPVMLTPAMSHLHLAQAFSSLVNVRNVWVYDNGRLLNSQPFTSYFVYSATMSLYR